MEHMLLLNLCILSADSAFQSCPPSEQARVVHHKHVRNVCFDVRPQNVTPLWFSPSQSGLLRSSSVK